MPSSQVYQLHIGPITAFSFNADGSKVAISPNSNDVDIYAKKGQGFTKTETLSDVPLPRLLSVDFC
jgi:actin related protein 2/3 complex subunit 1A/1B